VSGDAKVKERLMWMMDLFADKIYNPSLHRQEVFFDKNYNSLLDLHSYGHDIETAWLIDRGAEVVGEEKYVEKMSTITKDLTAQIYKVAFDGHSLANECCKGTVNTHRIWWVQAETIVGFLNGYEKNPSRKEYLEAAENQWQFITEYVIDPREGSEWYWEVEQDGTQIEGRPIVEPWKCPYHNGRMCLEVIRRMAE
jgi:mannobiose 2-epimerase